MGGSADSRTGGAAALFDLTATLASEHDRRRLIARIVSSARALTGAERGCCFILDKTKRHLLAEGCDPAQAGQVQDVPLFVKGDRNNRHMVAHSAFTGRIVCLEDPYRYTGFDFTELYDADRRHGRRTFSLMTAPMRNHEGLTIGVLQLFNRLDGPEGHAIAFDAASEDLIGQFARQAAVSLNNLRLIEENARLIHALDESNRALREENARLKQSMAARPVFDQIIGSAPAMQRVFDLMAKVVDTDATVLVQGETGSGKELIASSIHASSKRRTKGFVAQNCAALPETLLESELFGYKKGAFSGAERDKKGLIELADGGTLFLDEIGDMPLNLQSKLLRVLQEREVRPLGGLQSIKVDVRVIAATHNDLKAKIRDGRFREDLYYRLAVFPIEMPPVRDRRDDVPLLVRYFLDAAAKGYGKQVRDVAPSAMECFLSYDYPGNVRELKNLVERAVLMVEDGGIILPDHLAPELREASAARPAAGQAPPAPDPAEDDRPLRQLLDAVEARAIRHRLDKLGGNQTRAAKALGISRRTLIEKMQKHGLVRQGESAGPEP